jgi:hypothetical protein
MEEGHIQEKAQRITGFSASLITTVDRVGSISS